MTTPTDEEIEIALASCDLIERGHPEEPVCKLMRDAARIIRFQRDAIKRLASCASSLAGDLMAVTDGTYVESADDMSNGPAALPFGPPEPSIDCVTCLGTGSIHETAGTISKCGTCGGGGRLYYPKPLQPSGPTGSPVGASDTKEGE